RRRAFVQHLLKQSGARGVAPVIHKNRWGILINQGGRPGKMGAKQMKTNLALLAAAVAMLAAPAFAGETLDRVMKTGKLTMSSDPEYPPQSFLNDSNELDGFDVDVGKEIAKRLGVDFGIETP